MDTVHFKSVAITRTVPAVRLHPDFLFNCDIDDKKTTTEDKSCYVEVDNGFKITKLL